MRVWSEALAEQSISVGAEAQVLGLGVSAFANEVESEALTLSEEAEHGAFEAPRFWLLADLPSDNAESLEIGHRQIPVTGFSTCSLPDSQVNPSR